MDKLPDAKFTGTDPEDPQKIKDDIDANDEVFSASHKCFFGIYFNDLLYINVIANIEGEKLCETIVLDEKERYISNPQYFGWFTKNFYLNSLI